MEIVPEDDGLSADPRSEEIMRLVAANTPSHRAAWKKNSKAWQVFFSRRERRAGEADPEAIEEEGNYVLDDFDPAPGRRFNGVADSDVTDEDENDGKSFSVVILRRPISDCAHRRCLAK